MPRGKRVGKGRSRICPEFEELQNPDIDANSLKPPLPPSVNPNLDQELEKLEKSKVDTVAPIEEDPVKKKKWEPENWKIIFNNIRQMRSKGDAPVDTMGCHMCQEEDAEPNVRRFQTLLSLMLSAQTKDQVTFAAMDRLKGGEERLTIQKILKIEESDLGELIQPVGFWRRKASFIKKTAQILHDEYNDDIPDTIEGLCSLPGVGQKMAHLCMEIGWKVTSGIGVDTHVHRISNRLRWTGKKETNTPEKTRVALEEWIPQELWSEVNWLLVGFGQTICLPVGPKCEECLNKSICPFGRGRVRSLQSKAKRGKNVQIESDEEEGESGESSKYFK